VKAGKGRNQVQRYKCQQCGKRFTEPQEKPCGENVRIKQEVVVSILHCLLEGNSCAPRYDHYREPRHTPPLEP
jgi:transposase-like protein